MKNKLLGIVVCTLMIAASTTLIGTTVADWDPEDGHKMHFPQMPDPNGWDVHATAPIELADDWKCSETGYVKDIHLWGSWLGDNKGVITSFNIAIYTNNPGPPSKPKDLKWEREIVDWVERGPYSGDQGWYWPENDWYLWHDHQLYYQYNFFLDEPWFLQEEGKIYWLVISANVQGGTWGWKSSKNHYMDDAVWRAPGGDWKEMYEPEPPITNQFWFTMIEREPVEAGGTDYFDDGTSFNGWYYYPYYYPDWWWWNIWFYNAPFSYDKYKDIYVSFICDPMSPDPVFFVINWATDYWEPGGPPPLPRDVPDPQYEDMVIGRWPSGVQPIPVEPGFNEFWLTIPDYNPEWVSIDFMGTSFTIVDGIIIHQCLPPAHAESLDLAFVITGEPAEEPCIEIEKKVKDSDGNWVEEIDAEVCTNVEFKIDVHNCGNPDLTNIKVVDTLPACLEYVAGSGDPSEPTIVGNQLTWTFPGPLTYCNTKTIKFKAHVISKGENINRAKVTADTPDGGSVTDTDTATVNGIGIPHVDIEKWVSVDDGATWSDEVTADVCTTVRFKIEVHNDGDYDLTNIKVVDTLPACLEYKDNAIPKEPDGIVGNMLTWTFPGPLKYCEKITIEFDAHVITKGENVNEATVTADSDEGSVTGTATATVWAGEKPIPKIGCGGSLSWTRVPPGSTQTGTITVSNIGDPGSKLKWKVCGNPTWGSWSFNPPSGTGLTPAMGPLSITVTVVAPTQQNQQFSGQITLCNEEDITDTCTIPVSLATPKNKPYINTPFLKFLENLMEQHPLLLPMLRCLLRGL